MPLAAMPRTVLKRFRKVSITSSASNSSACENLSTARSLDGNSRDFKARATHQLGNADECARRIVVVKIRAVDGIELVVEIKIRAIDGDRYQVRHRQPAFFQGLLDRIHHQPRLGFGVGRNLPGRGIDTQGTRAK